MNDTNDTYQPTINDFRAMYIELREGVIGINKEMGCNLTGSEFNRLASFQLASLDLDTTPEGWVKAAQVIAYRASLEYSDFIKIMMEEERYRD